MLNHLRDLIFGLNDYEKSKLEQRFEETSIIISKISIQKIEDFEILEDIIYKLKEQLRIKSSNLNKAIKDPSRNITKKKVDEIIEKLNNLKYNFLEHAFDVVDKVKKIEDVSVPELNIEPVSEFKTKEVKQTFENPNYSFTVENGKVPYIIINFKDDIDYAIVKKISSIFFESYKMDGTNILQEENKVLVIPRKIGDSLFTMPRIQSNFEEVLSKLINLNSEEKEEPIVKDAEYKEISEEKREIKNSRKKNDDSLDSLLGGITKEKKEEPPKEESQNIEEKKDEVTKKEIPKEKEEIKIEKEEGKVSFEKNEIKKNPEIELISVNDVELKNIIYQDENIVVFLNSESKVLGEINIKRIDNKNIKNMNESDLSYITIFAKIFASVLFETMQAHGTNMIWDYNNNIVKIIPRMQNDNLNILWKPKHNKDDFMEQIKKKLLDEMQKELQNDTKMLEKTAESNKNIGSNTPIENSKSHSKEEKLNHILKHIRRLA